MSFSPASAGGASAGGASAGGASAGGASAGGEAFGHGPAAGFHAGPRPPQRRCLTPSGMVGWRAIGLILLRRRVKRTFRGWLGLAGSRLAASGCPGTGERVPTPDQCLGGFRPNQVIRKQDRRSPRRPSAGSSRWVLCTHLGRPAKLVAVPKPDIRPTSSPSGKRDALTPNPTPIDTLSPRGQRCCRAS
jgi:hypothetical protein